MQASLSHGSTHTAQWEWLHNRSKDRMGSRGHPVKKLVGGTNRLPVPLLLSCQGESISENRLLLCRLKVKINELLNLELYKNSKVTFGNAERPICLLPSWQDENWRTLYRLRENPNTLQHKIQLNLCPQQLPNHINIRNIGGLGHRALRGQGRKQCCLLAREAINSI